MFLDRPKTQSKIRELIRNDEDIAIAVAYWGDGAVESLAIDKVNKNINIVCSLRAGATNPSVIEKLIALEHVEIRHLDGLHSKLYMSNSRAIIGSSNASSNGLSLSNSDIDISFDANWYEANYLITDPSHVQDALKWFKMVWRKSREINDIDMSKAKRQWKLQRKNRFSGNLITDESAWSLEQLKRNSSILENRAIFVEHQEWANSPTADKLAKQELSNQGIPDDTIQTNYNWTYENKKNSDVEYDLEAYYLFLTTGPLGGNLSIDMGKFIDQPFIQKGNTSVWIYRMIEEIPLDAENKFSICVEIKNAIVRRKMEILQKGTSIKAFFGLASSRLGERIAGIFDIRLIWPSCASPVQASSLLFRSGVGFRAH